MLGGDDPVNNIAMTHMDSAANEVAMAGNSGGDSTIQLNDNDPLLMFVVCSCDLNLNTARWAKQAPSSAGSSRVSESRKHLQVDVQNYFVHAVQC